MPVEDSNLEHVVDLTAKCSEDALGELVEKLGRDKAVTLEDIRSVLTPPAGDAAGLPRGARRKRLVELLYEKNLLFSDPARESLAADLAGATDGFVGSDLESLCREAGMLALREGKETVAPRHFEEAKKKVHPTMNDNLREYYGKIQQHFKGGLPKQVQPPEYQ
jgi:transitional endoplasmic reticulum ATPase